MALTPIVWNRQFSDEPRPTTINGMPGYWTLPREWYTRPVAGNLAQLEASPNADFSGEVVTCELSDDGITLAFQSIMRNKLAGLEP